MPQFRLFNLSGLTNTAARICALNVNFAWFATYEPQIDMPTSLFCMIFNMALSRKYSKTQHSMINDSYRFPMLDPIPTLPNPRLSSTIHTIVTSCSQRHISTLHNSNFSPSLPIYLAKFPTHLSAISVYPKAHTVNSFPQNANNSH